VAISIIKITEAITQVSTVMAKRDKTFTMEKEAIKTTMVVAATTRIVITTTTTTR
jgi:hypothetical protein